MNDGVTKLKLLASWSKHVYLRMDFHQFYLLIRNK
jgi:hypothetical protein